MSACWHKCLLAHVTEDDMSVILRPDFPKPHRINAFRGATLGDVVKTREDVDALFKSFRLMMDAYLTNIQDHLPIGEVDFLDILESLHDTHSDTVGRLEYLEEKCREPTE